MATEEHGSHSHPQLRASGDHHHHAANSPEADGSAFYSSVQMGATGPTRRTSGVRGQELGVDNLTTHRMSDRESISNTLI